MPPSVHVTSPPALAAHLPSVSRTQNGHAQNWHVSLSSSISQISHPPPRDLVVVLVVVVVMQKGLVQEGLVEQEGLVQKGLVPEGLVEQEGLVQELTQPDWFR